ncbi:MAG TPA: bacterial transcriptional activator domain-containing protein, partial [Burkholderiaceae bacterium]|nr:bacterial transcriptional activator domain-containing protein [Burkholderiaceae bacterium]
YAARAAFGVAVSRLRKLLGCAEALVVGEGRCALAHEWVGTDTAAFEHAVREARAPRGTTASDGETLRVAERLLALYRTDFLAGESEAPWAIEARVRYRGMFVQAVEHVLTAGLLARDLSAVIALGERAIEIEPLAEHVYQLLINAYLHSGRAADAKRVFRRCEQMLSVMLGMPPSAELRALVAKA